MQFFSLHFPFCPLLLSPSQDKLFSLGPKSDLVAAFNTEWSSFIRLHLLFIPLPELQSSPGMEKKGRTKTQKGAARLSLEDDSTPREYCCEQGRQEKEFWAQNNLGGVWMELGEALEQNRKVWAG